MPDWKNSSAYEYTTKLSPRCWAWEFLRRNPKYERDFLRWLAALAAVTKKSSPKKKVPSAKDIPELRHYSPPRRHGEDERTWYLRCVNEGSDPRVLRLDVALARKWGLHRLCDPVKDRCAAVHFRATPEVFVTPILNELVEEVQEQPDGLHAYARLSLNQDLSPQLEKVTKAARRLQSQMRHELGLTVSEVKHFRRKWRTYLRLLDARRAKAKWAEIAQVLFPDLDNDYPERKASRRARDMYKQALKYSTVAYRALLP